ncbi:MAG: methyltransferase, partial [Clostridiales bacterium]|nr:methyltransferase [Clostridiales bacterium]
LPGERFDDLFWGGLRIAQSHSVPAFSLDALLLADFLTGSPQDRLADLGAGTGVISLLALAWQKAGQVCALELMPALALLAEKSAAENGLQGQMRVVEGDLRLASGLLGAGLFDLVVCNPPFHRPQSGRPSPDPLLAAARSELFCSLEDVFREGAALLSTGGGLFLIHLPQRLEECFRLSRAYGLRPARLRAVHSFAPQPARAFLLELRKGGRGELAFLPPFVVYEREGVYSGEAAGLFASSAI